MRTLLLLMITLLPMAALGHQMSTAYFNANVGDTGLVAGALQIRLYDLEQTIGVDANTDGTLLWQELLNREDAVSEYLSRHLKLGRGGERCPVSLVQSWQIDTHFNEPYLVLPVRAQCALEGELSLTYDAFFEADSAHKLLVNVASIDGGSASSRVVSETRRTIVLNSENGNRWSTFREFVQQGVLHIWMGLDHVVFLLSLLLTCVLVRRGGRWVGNNNLRQIVYGATWVVTAFTIAHSLTLTATALGWLNLPSRWVEVGIALTVVAAALNNVYPLVLRLGWLTFGFGLLHGMGFAGVLSELGVPSDQTVLTVLSFNLGVEIGQLVIVGVTLPLLMLVRNKQWYSRYGLPAGSIIIAAVAVRWVIERV